MSYGKTVCGMGGIVRLCCFVRTVLIPQITSQQSQIAKTLDWYLVNMLVWDRCLVDIVPTVLFPRTYAQAGTMSDSALLLYSEFFPPKKLQLVRYWRFARSESEHLLRYLAVILCSISCYTRPRHTESTLCKNTVVHRRSFESFCVAG